MIWFVFFSIESRMNLHFPRLFNMRQGYIRNFAFALCDSGDGSSMILHGLIWAIGSQLKSTDQKVGGSSPRPLSEWRWTQFAKPTSRHMSDTEFLIDVFLLDVFFSGISEWEIAKICWVESCKILGDLHNLFLRLGPWTILDEFRWPARPKWAAPLASVLSMKRSNSLRRPGN